MRSHVPRVARPNPNPTPLCQVAALQRENEAEAQQLLESTRADAEAKRRDADDERVRLMAQHDSAVGEYERRLTKLQGELEAERAKSLTSAGNYIQMELDLRKAGKELDFARRDSERTKADLRFHLHDRTFRQVDAGGSRLDSSPLVSMASRSPLRETEDGGYDYTGGYAGTAGIPPSSSKIGEILSRVDRMGLPTPTRSTPSVRESAFMTPFSSSSPRPPAADLRDLSAGRLRAEPHLVRFPTDSSSRATPEPSEADGVAEE